MARLLVLVCCVVAALAAPPLSKTRKDVESFRSYLENAKPNNGYAFEEAMAANPQAKAWENSGKYQGDILLTDEQIEGMVEEYAGDSPATRAALIWPTVRWPGNTVIWEFAAGHFSSSEQTAIIRGFQEIERNTCVRFRQRTNEASFVRVTGNQDGCYAHAGYWAGFGVHTLNLARGCFHHFIIIHEWLHVVGLMHMHQNYSRYNYVWINWQNVIRGTESAFDLLPSNEVTMLGTPYQYESNMHYDAWAFSSNGQRTIGNRFNDGGLMGQMMFVPQWDWIRVNRAYNCPGAWSSGMHEGELATENLPGGGVPVEDVQEIIAEDVENVEVVEGMPQEVSGEAVKVVKDVMKEAQDVIKAVDNAQEIDAEAVKVVEEMPQDFNGEVIKVVEDMPQDINFEAVKVVEAV